MDKLLLTGQTLGRVAITRSGFMCAMHLCCYEAKMPNLKLKTQPNQPLGYIRLDIALTDLVYVML
jgi:hypothetical protein